MGKSANTCTLCFSLAPRCVHLSCLQTRCLSCSCERRKQAHIICTHTHKSRCEHAAPGGVWRNHLRNVSSRTRVAHSGGIVPYGDRFNVFHFCRLYIRYIRRVCFTRTRYSLPPTSLFLSALCADRAIRKGVFTRLDVVVRRVEIGPDRCGGDDRTRGLFLSEGDARIPRAPPWVSCLLCVSYVP